MNFGGNTSVSLAWRRPGDKRYDLLPASVYAPVAEATVGELHKTGEPYSADFSVKPVAESFAPPEYYLQREKLQATGVPTDSVLHWDFGDGQTAGNDARPNHIYLTPGIYNVTLTVKPHTVEFKGTRRIKVQDRMYSAFPDPPDDPYKTVSAVLEPYDLSTLTADQRLRGMLYCQLSHVIGAYSAMGQSVGTSRRDAGRDHGGESDQAIWPRWRKARAISRWPRKCITLPPTNLYRWKRG